MCSPPPREHTTLCVISGFTDCWLLGGGRCHGGFRLSRLVNTSSSKRSAHHKVTTADIMLSVSVLHIGSEGHHDTKDNWGFNVEFTCRQVGQLGSNNSNNLTKLKWETHQISFKQLRNECEYNLTCWPDFFLTFWSALLYTTLQAHSRCGPEICSRHRKVLLELLCCT